MRVGAMGVEGRKGRLVCCEMACDHGGERAGSVGGGGVLVLISCRGWMIARWGTGDCEERSEVIWKSSRWRPWYLP